MAGVGLCWVRASERAVCRRRATAGVQRTLHCALSMHRACCPLPMPPPPTAHHRLTWQHVQRPEQRGEDGLVGVQQAECRHDERTVDDITARRGGGGGGRGVQQFRRERAARCGAPSPPAGKPPLPPPLPLPPLALPPLPLTPFSPPWPHSLDEKVGRGWDGRPQRRPDLGWVVQEGGQLGQQRAWPNRGGGGEGG